MSKDFIATKTHNTDHFSDNVELISLTAENLPTENQLKQLLADHNGEAIIWYIWRNRLRQLPLLGSWSIKQIWPQTSIQRIFVSTIKTMVIHMVAPMTSAQW